MLRQGYAFSRNDDLGFRLPENDKFPTRKVLSGSLKIGTLRLRLWID
ncbi:MAG: hypothetical protein J6W29_06925 [Neisseriaceae bacterium]|nr:hypothetical protein [Neisseriaceae bacterium]